MKAFFKQYFELIFWVVALFLLATMDPNNEGHFSFCAFNLLGLDFCPGCGLGHSISYLFHGDLQNSLLAHPLGIFALPVICLRIFKLVVDNNFFNFKNNHHGVRT